MGKQPFPKHAQAYTKKHLNGKTFADTGFRGTFAPR